MSFLKFGLLCFFCSVIGFVLPAMAQSKPMNEPTVKVVENPKLGKILTDSKGMTLYMFTPDKNNTSVCYDKCSALWPPLLISAGQPILAPGIVGTLGLTNRNDNTRQVTYNGMPLYYYVKDKKPGDITGQKVENEWFVINPSPDSKK